MPDYTDSKSSLGGLGLDHGNSSDWRRVEPLMTAEQLVDRFLFGVPLVSAMKNPLTGKHDILTEAKLKDIIVRAVAKVENDIGIDIMPVQHSVKLPFDRNLYQSFNYLKLPHRPVASVESITITPANEVDIYTIPVEWVEMANAQAGQINIIPLTIGFQGSAMPVAASAGLLFNILGYVHWIPAFFKVKYTTGFPDGNVPHIVNEIIGIDAAIDVLSMLATTYAHTNSKSLGIDGLSQSSSGPGPQIFETRIAMLKEQRETIKQKLKAIFGLKLITSNI